VITTVLETPLTSTMLSLQAIVRFALIPETLSSPPGGGVGDVDGLGVFVPLADGPGLVGVIAGGTNVRETVGGLVMSDRTLDSWFATKAAMAPARTSAPMTMTVPRIHHTRLLDGGFDGGAEYAPPYVHGAGGGGGGGGPAGAGG
jgi:hypothetical protein